MQNAAYQSEATLEHELITQKNNDHGRKKQTVLDKMRAFFDQFFWVDVLKPMLADSLLDNVSDSVFARLTPAKAGGVSRW